MATIRFIDGIAFNSGTGEVHRNGTVIRLEPQPARVLRALASQPGELVTHDELRRAVWDDSTHVKVHDALHYCVRQIRAALGDTPRQPQFIETIPRRGYRLRPESLVLAGPGRTPWRTWGLRLAFAAGVLIAIVFIEQRPNNHHEIAVSALSALHDLVY